MDGFASWLWSGWDAVAFVAASTAMMFVAALVATRLGGRRTLAQMSAYDTMVTIALGTIIGGTAMAKEPPFSQALTALVTLLVLQAIVGMIRRRSERLRNALEFSPVVVFEEGQINKHRTPFGAQLTLGEVATKLRRAGIADLSDVALVIMERDGSFSTFGHDQADGDLVRDLRRREPN